MESVVVVAPCTYDAEFKARLAQLWNPMDNASGKLVIEDGGTRIYVYRNDLVAQELEPEELARITSKTREPVFYTVAFSDIALCRRVLAAIADDPRLLIDNDHGVLLSGPEFVRLLQSRPDWDWRRDRVSPK